MAESKICKPFVKPTNELQPVVIASLILGILSICLMVCFDMLVIKLPQDGQQHDMKSFSLLSFTALVGGVILYLSSGSFDKTLFCSMNIKEKICKKQGNYKHEGAAHTFDDQIYISAPCKIFLSKISR